VVKSFLLSAIPGLLQQNCLGGPRTTTTFTYGNGYGSRGRGRAAKWQEIWEKSRSSPISGRAGPGKIEKGYFIQAGRVTGSSAPGLVLVRWFFLLFKIRKVEVDEKQPKRRGGPAGSIGAGPNTRLDVWEHSYYIDYRKIGRPDYSRPFVEKPVNWGLQVTERYEGGATVERAVLPEPWGRVTGIERPEKGGGTKPKKKKSRIIIKNPGAQGPRAERRGWKPKKKTLCVGMPGERRHLFLTRRHH